MSKPSPTLAGLTALANEKPVLLHLADLKRLTGKPLTSCAEAMQEAAKYAASKKYPVIQFDHENPPRFYGPGSTSRTVVLADSSVYALPKSLVHVGAVTINTHNFAKLNPNYRESIGYLLKD